MTSNSNNHYIVFLQHKKMTIYAELVSRVIKIW